MGDVNPIMNWVFTHNKSFTYHADIKPHVHPHVDTFFQCLFKYAIKKPYALVMTYLGVFDSFVDDYKLANNNQLPPWYYYIWFTMTSFVYMLVSAKVVINNKLREHYRDKSLVEAIKQIDRNTIQLNYEWNKKHYSILMNVHTMQATEFIKATTTITSSNEDGSATTEVKDVSEAIKPFLGPNEDWHQMKYTPSTLGYNNLTMVKLDVETFDMVINDYNSEQVIPSIKNM